MNAQPNSTSRRAPREAGSRANTLTHAAAHSHALRPLVLALLSGFPMWSVAQTAIARPPVPATFVVPRPMPGWRVSGIGAVAPVNVPNGRGGVDQAINQTSQRAVYNWQSFDIGSGSSVTFNFPTQSSSSLNRVIGSPGPSQIFGSLKSQYTNPEAGKAPLPGGTIYLINQNGILFGRTAQVNTGALIASTLNLTDADFNAGLSKSITGLDPTFRYGGAADLFTDSANFVRVDAGANITTASGGRVFLFAKNVQNAGTISTPGGQTALAGGGEVYLNDPTNEPLYASEVNPRFPATRGLLVEVGKGNGSVSNLAGGLIDVPTGNATLVGMAVNQSGRISATTSVSENGSVMLLARGNAQALNSGVLKKQATSSGALTLGAGSQIEIAPDTTLGADGKALTSDGSSTFTASRVELAGKTIDLQAGSSVVAHGGVVNVRAELSPNYDAAQAQTSKVADTLQAARLVIGDGASIDVSGTTSTVVSAARNFVTTELLGKTDLKDAPLQRDGPLYRSKVTFDLRSAVPILGDTSSYQSAVKKTVDERLASGGTIALSSTGALVTHQGSKLDVSGGTVTYTDAVVKPTQLIAADGKRYTVNAAPADVLYVGIEGAAKAATLDRWGIVPQYSPTQASTGRLEQGYVDGAAGGKLSLSAPISLLDGHLAAATVAGDRQTRGADAVAAAGRVEIGFRDNGVVGTPLLFGTNNFKTAGVRELTIAASEATLSAPFWSAPLLGALPKQGRIAASSINESGARQVVISTDGTLFQEAGATVSLAPKSVLDLAAAGTGGLMVGGGFSSVGGSFAASTGNLSNASLNGPTVAGTLMLAAGQRIDVAGNWVNQLLDGTSATPAFAGGSVALSAARALILQDSSRIDVSGGGTVLSSGSVAGTNAGSVTLQSNNVFTNAADLPAAIHVGAVLKAQSLAGGGTLSVKAADVSIGAKPLPLGVADGATRGSLVMSEAFFRNGGFTSYQVDALRSLTVQPGTLIAPRTSNWVATADVRNVASGTRPSSFLIEGVLPESQRKPVSLRLTANGPASPSPSGNLSVAAGARIETDALATVSLRAGLNLTLEGQVQAPGGNVNLALVSTANADQPVKGRLIVDGSATIDVSGKALLQPSDLAVPKGKVVAGGNVSLSSNAVETRFTAIEVRPGAEINADGATSQLSVDTTTSAGSVATRVQTVSSAGGTITIAASDGGAALAGAMHAIGGAPDAAGGKFALSITGRRDPLFPRPTDPADRAIQIQDAPVTQAAAVYGTALVSAKSLRENFADVSLKAPDHITFNGNLDLSMPRELVLDAPALQALPGSRVQLGGGASVQLGGTPDSLFAPATAITGNSQLKVAGGLVELYGNQALQGFGQVAVQAASELRLNSVAGNTDTALGRFAVKADLTLSAPQVVPTSNSAFTIDAPLHSVLVTGGDATVAPPLSAGGSVTINAQTIAQNGVLRAPFGAITLNGTQGVTLGAGSQTSVSGAGMTVPFGSTSGGEKWVYAGKALNAPAEKTINLIAPGRQITLESGAALNLAGGGDLLGLEFVPGPGGSKDVFAGAAGGAFAIIPTITAYAPQDADILATKDAAGAVPSVALGRQITFGAGGPVPAGTYAVLPARYAVLGNAFLVRPVASAAPLALDAAVPKADGSVLVGARFGSAGTGFADSQTGSFQVMTSAQALRSSEIRQTSANDYFTAQAASLETTAPRRPIDAGRLNLVANAQVLNGSYDFGLPADKRARGGEIDVSADRILVSSNNATADAGVLVLQPAALNATGAALVVLGGSRGGASGSDVTVAASEVVIDNAGAGLALADLLIVAKNRVELKAGAPLSSTGNVESEALKLTGDGALLRLSGDGAASTTRTGVQRNAGDLVIGAGAKLVAESITAEGTRSAVIAADASVQADKSLTLGASRLAVGSVSPARLAPGTLLLTPALITQISHTESLTLRSFDGLDFYGTASVGGDALKALALDTGTVRLVGAGTSAALTAGKVTLTNTSGAAAVATAGSGELTIKATAVAGAGSGAGQVVIGPGSMAVAGARTVTLDAANEVLLQGQSQFAVGNDLLLRTAALEAQKAASAVFTAAGNVLIDAAGRASAEAGGSGAHVVINGASIAQRGNVVLPSGELSLNASGNAGSDAVTFGAGSVTDLSGRLKTFDSVTVATPGGDLRINAQAGNVVVGAGAVLDVSAPGAAGRAGSIAISAVAGSADLAGRLRGTSALGQPGGSLSVDTQMPLDLARLAASIDAERTPLLGNFGESLDVRNRAGDQTLVAGGPGLSARRIGVSSDAGSLTVAGSVTASGGSEPTVMLAGGAALTLTPTAQVAAHSSGKVGGRVDLLSGTATAAAGNGQINLTGGSIDTRAAAGGVDGQLLLRASVDASGTDVRVGPIATAINGAVLVDVEAVSRYAATVVDADLATRIAADNEAFAGTAGANAAKVLDRIGNGNSALRGKLMLRSGVEINSAGNLLVAADDQGNGWNLTRFDDAGQPLPQATGAPLAVTLRAAGNLNVAASISDGFSPAGDNAPETREAAQLITRAAVILPGRGADIRLVGGADLSAANVMATVRSTTQGDVIVGTNGVSGPDVLVRTTTGNVQVAAGRDVALANRQAAVYTTGTPVADAALTGYAGNLLLAEAYVGLAGQPQNPFLQGGGGVAVQAGRDVLGATGAGQQYASEWLWISGNQRPDGGTPLWYGRYDYFNQGFAAFGGGNVSASAGRDAKNVELSSATSGYVPNSGAATSAVFGGGNVSLQAGRDVVGGFVLAGQGNASVAAGRNISAAASEPALQVVYGETNIDVQARNNLDLGRLTSFGLVGVTGQYNNTAIDRAITGVSNGASLLVVAGAGDLTYRARSIPTTPTHSDVSGNRGQVIPSDASFAAPQGNVALGSVVQVPGSDGHLDIVAQGDVKVASVAVTATTPIQLTPTLISGNTSFANLTDPFARDQTPFDNSSRAPVRIVASDGTVNLSEKVRAVRPVRILAGQDIDFSGGSASGLAMQHQSGDELSLLQAGRDIFFPDFNNLGGVDLKLHGPGDLVLQAGRNIDLRASGGIGAVGNRENAALSDGSAAVTVLAGVPFIGTDYRRATAWFFPVLGGTGIAGYAPELAAQIEAAQAGQPLPALGSSAALAFKALPIDQRIAKAQALVGNLGFNAAVLAYVRRVDANGALDQAIANSRFAAMSASDQAAVVGAALAGKWSVAIAADQQVAQVLAMAALQGPSHSYADALASFVAASTGRSGLSVGQSLTAFAALPVERQLLFVNKVLASEVRTAGRAASALTGTERDAAYAVAYAAIDTVFPEYGAIGNVNMGSSQVRTFQGSDVALLTPRGGINVGELTAASQGKSASLLGIVTAAGGDIALIVRDNVAVNQSRVFTVGKGDLLMWSSEGNLDAGRGAKTVTGAPPPVFRFDDQGNFVIDTSGSFTGSGIAVLDAASTLDLYAPKGEINAGDAGIKSVGNAFFGAARFVGGDNLSIGGVAIGAPPPAPTGGATAGLGALGQAATSAGTRIAPEDSEEEKERKRRKRLNLILDFLGFGDGSGKN